jgi:hypothetical protein
VARAAEEASTDVIVDFDVDDGLLYVSVRNIASTPVYRVSVAFDKPFSGLGGRQETSELRLFRAIEFLAPEKAIRTLVDSTSSYFERKQPARLVADVRWRGSDGRRLSHRITHDLSIYKELVYVTRKETHAGPPA